MKRSEAKAAGLTEYVTGRPCKHGHVGPHRISDGKCIECRRAQQRGKLRHKTTASAVYMRDYRARNEEKLRFNSYRDRGMPIPTRLRPELCENCDRPPNGRGVLHNDHDHVTGAFRGWLCHDCNTGLGKLGDSLAGIERIKAYLTRAVHVVNTDISTSEQTDIE